MPDLLHRFVALVSRLAPGAARREFRAEWEAELATDPRFARAIGAVPDAWSSSGSNGVSTCFDRISATRSD